LVSELLGRSIEVRCDICGSSLGLDSNFGMFSVPTEQQTQRGYTGLETYYS